MQPTKIGVTQSTPIDRDRTERRAVLALAFGSAVWALATLSAVFFAARALGFIADLGIAFSIAMLDTIAMPGFAVAAVVLGHLARRRIRTDQSHGDGYASAGLVLGYVALVGAPVLIVLVWVVAFFESGLCCYV